MRGDHCIIGKPGVIDPRGMKNVNQLLDVVAAGSSRAVQESSHRISHVFVGERAHRKGNALAFEGGHSDRVAGQRKDDAPGAAQRAKFFRQARELRRIDRRLVASVVAAYFCRDLEQRQIRRRLESCQQRLELELAVEAIELGVGGHGVAATFPIDRQRQVASYDGNGPAEAGLLPVLFDQAFQLRIARKARIRNERVERAGRLKKFACGLFADAGNSGKVVRWVPFEAPVIRQLRGFEPEAFPNGERIVAPELRYAALRDEDGDAIVDDLQ